MATPHNSAKLGDFGKTVLMPGDPLRAKFVAETFLTNARLVNNVRGINGYTGEYKGKTVSVMASGMGMPSMGIYSYELFSMYDVDNIIRIGSAGSINMNIHVRDLVFGMGACTNSNYASQYKLPGSFAPIASYKLLSTAVDIAKELNLNYHVGNLLSSDTFYNDDADATEKWANLDVMAIEMEAAALYMNAAKLRKNALAICTISDHILTGEATTAEERQNTFTSMMETALEVAYRV
ncbi:MAG: purine-nucleoside phosphorylase [Ruminococcaceae bacterium]|nr:purine-nucleoside phosphorylase [Oscillospiraceae bacterium]